MIGSLTMKYNRGRQAAITNELVDIITGASGKCQYFSFLAYGSLCLVPVRLFPHLLAIGRTAFSQHHLTA